ncbi:hypothetical protein HYI36_19970 [Bacillus sp. Gen3]|uniref:Uncharacterized protein n=1 Tax=Heyndrickxia oleronia TaxID=38875 RepID=A0AAW6SRD4_9BACI|nr:hypothetical protein [Heyndrickxia oleronia]MDH5159818.1 hypothetical protein [Heyndrickxia oleronia]NYV67558.1 hypothetical protein [Bacillus sp. Gen3]
MHRIFQIHHIPPWVLFNQPKRYRLFVYASEQLAEEERKKGGNTNGV